MKWTTTSERIIPESETLLVRHVGRAPNSSIPGGLILVMQHEDGTEQILEASASVLGEGSVRLSIAGVTVDELRVSIEALYELERN